MRGAALVLPAWPHSESTTPSVPALRVFLGGYLCFPLELSCGPRRPWLPGHVRLHRCCAGPSLGSNVEQRSRGCAVCWRNSGTPNSSHLDVCPGLQVSVGTHKSSASGNSLLVSASLYDNTGLRCLADHPLGLVGSSSCCTASSSYEAAYRCRTAFHHNLLLLQRVKEECAESNFDSFIRIASPSVL